MTGESMPASPALAAALKMVKASDRFEAEVRRGLETKGFPAEEIDIAIVFLQKRKILDDRRTTQNLIERRSGRRAAGIEKLRAELQSRGAPEEIVDECLAELTQESQRESMLDALRGKFRPGDDRSKGARFLLGRGFAEDEIEGALDEFFQPDPPGQ